MSFPRQLFSNYRIINILRVPLQELPMFGVQVPPLLVMELLAPIHLIRLIMQDRLRRLEHNIRTLFFQPSY